MSQKTLDQPSKEHGSKDLESSDNGGCIALLPEFARNLLKAVFKSEPTQMHEKFGHGPWEFGLNNEQYLAEDLGKVGLTYGDSIRVGVGPLEYENKLTAATALGVHRDYLGDFVLVGLKDEADSRVGKINICGLESYGNRIEKLQVGSRRLVKCGNSIKGVQIVDIEGEGDQDYIHFIFLEEGIMSDKYRIRSAFFDDAQAPGMEVEFDGQLHPMVINSNGEPCALIVEEDGAFRSEKIELSLNKFEDQVVLPSDGAQFEGMAGGYKNGAIVEVKVADQIRTGKIIGCLVPVKESQFAPQVFFVDLDGYLELYSSKDLDGMLNNSELYAGKSVVVGKMEAGGSDSSGEWRLTTIQDKRSGSPIKAWNPFSDRIPDLSIKHLGDIQLGDKVVVQGLEGWNNIATVQKFLEGKGGDVEVQVVLRGFPPMELRRPYTQLRKFEAA